MNIEIQDAEPEDAPNISKVFYECWLDTYPNTEYGVTREDIEFFYKDSFTPDALQKRRKQIEDIPVTERFMTAKINGKIVGVCRLIKHPNKNELKSIYILSPYRGKGIGRIFLNEMSKFFNNDKDITVTVAVYNVKAQGFYKKLGFVDTGERFSDEKFRMKSGSIIPDLVMVKKA